jgi:hypothetical protein
VIYDQSCGKEGWFQMQVVNKVSWNEWSKIIFFQIVNFNDVDDLLVPYI